MRRLLIQTEPLQVLPELAAQIGLNEAIVLQQLHYWLEKSKHEHDGCRWIYNTFDEWQAQFPFWSERTLQRIMAELVRLKLVRVENLKKANWDRTNWYTIEYEAVEKLEEKAVEISSKCAQKRLLIASKRQSVGHEDDNLASSRPRQPDVLSLYREQHTEINDQENVVHRLRLVAKSATVAWLNFKIQKIQGGKKAFSVS